MKVNSQAVVIKVTGVVTAESIEGHVRILQEGDVVFSDEVVLAELFGEVVLQYHNGESVTSNHNNIMLVDDISHDLFVTGTVHKEETEVGAEGWSNQLIANEGGEIVIVDYLQSSAEPDMGFLTGGVTQKFIEENNTPAAVVMASNEAPLNEIDVNEAPLNEVDVNEAPLNEVDVNEAPLNEVDVNEVALYVVPVVDLDGNDSTAVGTEYLTSYALAGRGIGVTDLDLSVFDPDSDIQSATVVLVTPQLNDILFSSAVPDGIIANAYDLGTGTITLTGIATTADYEKAIREIKFYNGDAASDSSDRIINVSVIDADGASSNTVTTTIKVANNSLSISSQQVVEEGDSAIFRIELETARSADTKFILNIAGDVSADDYYGFGEVTRNVQYESAPGVWTDVLVDDAGNYYVMILSSSATSFIDVKIKTKADAVSEDDETLILSAAIDIAASGDLTKIANTSAFASTLITELPSLFVSAPSSITEGGDAVFEVGMSNIKTSNTSVTLSIGGDVSPTDYDQTAFKYSVNDGISWITVHADVNGGEIEIPADGAVSRSVLVKVSILTDAITEGVESIRLAAVTSDSAISTSGSRASDSSIVNDPVILFVNEAKDGDYSPVGTTVTTVNEEGFDYIKVSNGVYGTVTDNADGTLSYVANSDFSGSDSFTFIKVNSVTGERSNATADVTVMAIADTPTIAMSVNNKVVEGLPEVIVDGGFAVNTADLDGTDEGNPWKDLDAPGLSGNYRNYNANDDFVPTTGEAVFAKSTSILQFFGANSLNHGDSYTLSFNTNLEVTANLTVRFAHIAADNSIKAMPAIYVDQIIATGGTVESIAVIIPDSNGDGSGLVANAIIFENTSSGSSVNMIIDNISLSGDITYTYDVNISYSVSDLDNSFPENEFIQDTVALSGVPTGAIFTNTTGEVGIDNGAGNWIFTQAELDALKITVSEAVATSSLGFTLTAMVTSEEATNGASTEAKSISVTVVDSNDVPLIGSNALVLANEQDFVTTLNDTIDVYFSTDGGNYFSWNPSASTLPDIYADGKFVSLTYAESDTTFDGLNDKGTLTGKTADGTTVFTVEITMDDGTTKANIVYTQGAELLGIKQTFDGGIVLPGGGGNDSIVLEFNNKAGLKSGVNAIVEAHNLIEDSADEIISSAAEYIVNTGNYYIGVDSNNMNSGDQLTFDFVTAADDGFGNQTSRNDVLEMEISLFNFSPGQSGDALYITVITGDDFATATREVIALTNDSDVIGQYYTVSSSTGGAFIGVEFLAGNESSFKLGIESISSINYNADFDMALSYSITDTDGDSDAGSVVISLDGDENIIYDSNSTAINAGDEQSSNGGGEDILTFNSGDSIDFSLDNSDLLNFEVIDLTNDANTGTAGVHSLTSIKLQDILDMTDSGNVLKILGDSADTVSLLDENSNTWVLDPTQELIDSINFNVYTSGMATVKIEDSIVSSVS